MYMVSKRQMPKHDCAAAYRAVGTDTGAACNTDTARKRRMGADVNVVSDLNQVVELDALFNHGVRQGAAVYAGVGTDLDIVANTHAAQLLDFFPTSLMRRKAKTVSADNRTRMNNTARTDAATIGECDAGAKAAMLPNRRISPHHAMFCHVHSRAHHGACTDTRERSN